METIKKPLTREEIKSEDKWDVKKIYEDDEAWEKEFQLLREKAVDITKFYGKLSEANMLYDYLKMEEYLSRIASKLAVYAHLRSDEDTTNQFYLSMKNKINTYLAELEAMSSYFIPEILSYPQETIEKQIEKLPKLAPYRFYLEQIIKRKDHILDENSEKLLASVSDCLSASSQVFGLLTNADMTFPTIKNEEGNRVELVESEYLNYITSKNREVRKDAFRALFQTYGKYRNTLATLLTSSVKNYVFESKIRNYNSALESSLEPDNIPVEVYKKSLETIHQNLSSLHRYVRIKKKQLNLSEIHMYDLYAPIIDVPKVHIEFEQGISLMYEGLKPLGEEYQAILREGVQSGWIDKYPNKGKRSGAYSSGCYDTMPYVLLNYTYGLEDVSTLVHEMGHSVHSYYTRKNQPYIYGDYTLFCAEVASITNEVLLMHYLVEKETDREKKRYLINLQLEKIRTTVFRQLMFAEFELYTHEQIEQGNSLTADDLCNYWHTLNKQYFGPEMVVDEEIDMEWARIPHFYRDFYVYQYATGYAAANSFAKMILDQEDKAIEKYIGFLKSGSSDYPINILKKAGVDMTTGKALNDTIQIFNELLDLLETI
ncbi:oligoendopeptidase F [Candidatus Galacturonibacter soehngenii]|uniref:Oligopeptidase F n=1 Tax=Candidatus Galacturonatibacter soehngenii TaxID=2307010 RepID=A0A7V7QK81_9FIRM|nr:oligoendopeptidase F [Candidatus Galacturonibacter soehngenii]KAB1437863.1 oligoendopeptidase F [Candidatus Galacturonibacter soehngenii]MBA4687364.1 oligoendopeptidase F [Candidatus Galacturonibacter soehngenii]